MAYCGATPRTELGTRSELLPALVAIHVHSPPIGGAIDVLDGYSALTVGDEAPYRSHPSRRAPGDGEQEAALTPHHGSLPRGLTFPGSRRLT